jgi:hypothetical protein
VSTSDPDRLVRPYLITGGRTHTVSTLEIETLVEVTDLADERCGSLQFEARRVIELCQEPVSIAEIAALIAIPLGVARVLVADLAEADLLEIHRTVSPNGPDIPLLERLLDELRSS